jgi:hypothetical protein
VPNKKIIDIKTRKPLVFSDEVMALAVQLIEMIDATEIAALFAILLHDVDDIPRLDGAPDTPEVREAVYEILNDAKIELERLADSFK